MVLVPPVLLITRRAVLWKLEVVKEPVGVLLMVPGHGIDRDVLVQVLGLVEILVLPLVIVRTGRDQIARLDHEIQLVVENRPELLLDECDDSVIDGAGVHVRDRAALRV